LLSLLTPLYHSASPPDFLN